ncbi:MAG: tRNA (N6-threonylcarbamoyladenosine(37)-N6)-methyltransferase TrmO [Methanomicrobiaceae archaeon]|nr:tRNA (N6-threonylcarbamoyladenosine(37)-N6)-methyltransferase TrmO [Methanomicrobiaceae archaeon]
MPEDAPRQGRLVDTRSKIEIFPPYKRGLECIERYSHLFILYWMDRADRTALSATPPGTHTERGVFATRSPHRPNPIGIGVVDLLEITGRILSVRGLDALDETPVLDITPYVSSLDAVTDKEMH